MAQLTVLQMTQNILSAMSSDEVNSIGDTVESMQVAQILQNKYYDIVARGDLTLDDQLFQLNPSDNSNSPVLMSLPTGTMRINWLRYYDTNPLNNTQVSQFGSYSHDLNVNIVSSIKWTVLSTSTVTIVSTGIVSFTLTGANSNIQVGNTVQAQSGSNSMFARVASYNGGTALTLQVISSTGSGTFSNWTITSVAAPNVPPGYKYVDIVPLDYFMDVTGRFDITQPDVLSYNFVQNGQNFIMRYLNDRQPTMCTVVSNLWVLFDSYDNTQDSTLQASKSLVYGQVVPPFLLQDNFIPVLDDFQFPLLLNESKSLAFFELKQQSHPVADKEIQRQWAVTQKTKSKANKPSYFDQLSNYGYVPRTGGYGGYPLYRWMRNSPFVGTLA
jgi:hypothetical protein